ncbi:hypothetical protein Cgig2_024304 [Carnegiea gigantea]|uniref:AB hydrolase-1 domain-containing protein n=1 Tax=Carnegiea gigantea TaxID=171969 RepID=A0A9Q1JP52_9CARY|nr:hypothetical protein Cgig2_024304 [Carnegiea gigantea]
MVVITKLKEDKIDPPGSPSNPNSNPNLNPKPNPNPNPDNINHLQPHKESSFEPVYFLVLLDHRSLSHHSSFYFSLLSFPSKLQILVFEPTGHPPDRLFEQSIIKVRLSTSEPAIEVFKYSKGSKSSENVLIVHGLGCSSFTFCKVADDLASKGVFAMAIDLPGSGFSDKAVVKDRDRLGVEVLGVIHISQLNATILTNHHRGVTYGYFPVKLNVILQMVDVYQEII